MRNSLVSVISPLNKDGGRIIYCHPWFQLPFVRDWDKSPPGNILMDNNALHIDIRVKTEPNFLAGPKIHIIGTRNQIGDMYLAVSGLCSSPDVCLFILPFQGYILPY